MTYRLTWYNPLLAPTVTAKLTDDMAHAVDYGYYAEGGPLNLPDEAHPFNLISSLCEDGLHRPALDVDHPFTDLNVGFLQRRFPGAMVLRSTSGNCHVYCDEPAMAWDEYQIYLWDCVSDGWVEDRYVEHSIHRGQSLLRAPGVLKHWQVKQAVAKGADLLR